MQLTTKYKPQDVKQLEDLFHMCVSKNLEGLVVKDLKGVYQPNARHWIKIKKEHFQGMGDSADLLVLGMYYGTGSKGGKMSIFLMGVYDEDEDNFKTVCKVSLNSEFSNVRLTWVRSEMDLPIKKLTVCKLRLMWLR